ncbi:MAG: phosphoribosylformylglycinamidine cyclo-ligase, partial [Desulfobacteraceae bacterium 4572_35.1]
RKVFFEIMGLKPTDKLDGLKQSIGLELLTPTRIYVKTILNLIRDFNIKGIAHITGGGILENIPRVLPNHCQATIKDGSWEQAPIFKALQEGGNIDKTEMHRTFNNGLGMILVVPSDQCDEILIRLSGLDETAWEIGIIESNKEDKAKVVLA